MLNVKLLREEVTREREKVTLKGFNNMKYKLYGNENLLFHRHRS